MQAFLLHIMSVYAIADLHLSFGTTKSMDIFEGWENYTSKLESNWRKKVSDNDTVVIAGDISWAMTLQETFPDFKFIHNLPGKKIFIKGNHDYWWTTRNKMQNFFKSNDFDDLSIIFNSSIIVDNLCICGTKGFLSDFVNDDPKLERREAGRLENSIIGAKRLGKEPVVFLHYPPIYCGNKSQYILNVLTRYNIKHCYYGHIHGKNAHHKSFEGSLSNVNFHLISCDHLNFTPLLVKA